MKLVDEAHPNARVDVAEDLGEKTELGQVQA